MKAFSGVLVVAVAIFASATVEAQGRGAKGRVADDTERVGVERVGTRPATQVSIVFSPREVSLIRTHYASQYRNLPPGLQKKVARGGSLPPGWQKKMQTMPRSLEIELVSLPGGYRRGVMDGHAVIYDPLTHAILDIISLF